jgi:hypothetical protein
MSRNRRREQRKKNEVSNVLNILRSLRQERPKSPDPPLLDIHMRHFNNACALSSTVERLPPKQ